MRNMNSRRGAKLRRKALLMIAAGVAVVVAFGVAVFLNLAPALDQATLCPVHQPATTSVAILVDTTDPLTPIQAARLRGTIREARESIPTFGKLTLLFLEADKAFEPRELVSLCNPGSPRGINPLFQTESRVTKRWMEAFGTPIDRAISTVLSSPTAIRSPIIEAITAAAWRPDFDSRTANRRVVVVSDMLQHEPGGYSHYGERDLWRSFERSKLAKEADANLEGVYVDIEYLRRPSAGASQSESHRAFWRRWFVSRGARAVRFVGMTETDERGSIAAARDGK